MIANEPGHSYDIVIVGAGFAGVYQLYAARKAGFKARVLEAGSGVGGTWYWNRYPGARCDVESLDYSYSFDNDLQQEWTWSERYAQQPEILRYINHVADRFDLKRDIQVNTRVSEAVFDEATNRWNIVTTDGEKFDARFCVMATGCLSIPLPPKFKNLDSFKGRWVMSSNWPKEGLDLTGQRVGIIGTGSSSVQMVPIVAEQAAHLTVFQRTANFSVPSQNEPLSEETIKKVKANYGERRQRARHTMTGHDLIANERSALDMGDEERQKELEFRWKGAGGGFRMMRVFSDLLTNKTANDYAAEFARSKIRQIVKDPKTAETLCPKSDLPFATKRLCVDTHYYETFNRDNVSLVDVKAAPIEEITPTGLRTTDASYELDVIVFATGFDAMTGALNSIDIRGIGGQTLKSKWAHGPLTYLGLAIAGFPNMFVIAGPGSPSVLSNFLHSIEMHVDWLVRLFVHARDKTLDRIEANAQAESDWVAHLNAVADKTLYPTAASWYMGANVPGKPRVFMPYVAGIPTYRHKIETVEAHGYDGFELSGLSAHRNAPMNS